MRFAMLVSLLRPVGPVVIGISLGFTLSLLSVSWVDESCHFDDKNNDDVTLPQDGTLKGARKPSSISTSNDVDSEEDFEPRIIPFTQVPQTSSKKLFRAKYVSTELGMRERLFVGVLTSKATLNTLGVAVNHTISHHLDHLVFFTGTHQRKVPHGMPVVTHGDERPIWNMYQTVKHVVEHSLDEYDWFYLVQDNTYTEADRVKALVGHLSMERQLYMGVPEEFIGGGATEGRYCAGAFGYLLSRTLLLRLQPFLEDCRNDILSSAPDEWLGRCIVDYTTASCVGEHEGLKYSHYKLDKNSSPYTEGDEHFNNALTVHPVSDPEQMYRLHKHFTELELQRTYSEIAKLQAEIKNVSVVAFDGNRTAQWPVGVTPPFEPKTRFEVLRWEYFTEEHIFSCADGAPKCELRGADRADVADVIGVALDRLNDKYKPVLHLKKQQLINGYRRFDPTRGMEYTLDLQLEAVNQKGHSGSLAKRVHLVRPLSHIEIIPMPYVTEATRVHVIVPLTQQDRGLVNHLLEGFAAGAFEAGENAVLTFLFIYDPLEAQRVTQDDIFAGAKAQIDVYERKYPAVKIPWISVKTETPSQIKFMDIISKKHPVDTLFFLADVNTNVNSEFLNRCRMNSINNWQVFFPVHFQDFRLAVAHQDQQAGTTARAAAGDLAKEAGLFDRGAFDEACFYNADYMAARTHLAADAQENEELLESLDIYDMFVKYSVLHVFRAVEPALRRRHREQPCNPRLGEDIYHRCVQSSLEGLGSRSQLAMLLFEQEQRGNST